MLKKKAFLISCLFSNIYSMQQEDPRKESNLPYELKETIRDMIRKESERSYTTGLSGCNFKEIVSKNHTKFEENAGKNNVIEASVSGEWDSETYIFSFLLKNSTKNELDEYLLSNDGNYQFDGPNGEGLIILGGYKNETCEFCCYLINMKKSSKLFCRCWCCPGTAFNEVNYAFAPQQGSLRTLAVHNKTNKFALISAIKKSQNIAIYDAEDIKNPKHITTDTIMLESNVDAYKKISFITDNVLAVLTFSGQLLFLFINKDKTISYHPQKLELSSPIVTMAVDSSNPSQMIMLLQDQTLLYGDIKNKIYSIIARNIELQDIWYDNDTVYYSSITDKSEKLGKFHLLPFKYAWIPFLIETSIKEQKRTMVS